MRFVRLCMAVVATVMAGLVWTGPAQAAPVRPAEGYSPCAEDFTAYEYDFAKDPRTGENELFQYKVTGRQLEWRAKSRGIIDQVEVGNTAISWVAQIKPTAAGWQRYDSPKAFSLARFCARQGASSTVALGIGGYGLLLIIVGVVVIPLLGRRRNS